MQNDIVRPAPPPEQPAPPQPQPAAQPVQPKPTKKPKTNKPIGVITLAIFVCLTLMALAVYAGWQQTR